MKALKKICTALMILAFAFVFASCSNGSDSDDDDSSTNVLLPSSVGENVLAGNSYKYAKSAQKTTTYAFKDNTVTKTKVDSSETEIWEYKYTYNANTGLLYLNLVSVTIDDKKMTSMEDMYIAYAEKYDMTVEEVKEEFGDVNMFAETISMCYFVKANGNILLGNYFDNEKDVKYSRFFWKENVARIKAQDMVNSGYFSHTSPTYGSPFDMLKSFKVSYRTAGENIAGNSTNTGAVNAWMNSEGHKANILNNSYNYTGIAVVSSPKYGKIYVQMFIGR